LLSNLSSSLVPLPLFPELPRLAEELPGRGGSSVGKADDEGVALAAEVEVEIPAGGYPASAAAARASSSAWSCLARRSSSSSEGVGLLVLVVPVLVAERKGLLLVLESVAGDEVLPPV